jgi:FKBP-type peptidyl-prolyl cis-trans isomerase
VKSRLIPIIIFFSLPFISCEEHEGYERLDDGIYCRRVSFEETGSGSQTQDKLIEMRARYFAGEAEQKAGPFTKNEAGFDTVDTRLLPEPLKSVFRNCHKGDSLHLMLEPKGMKLFKQCMKYEQRQPFKIAVSIHQSEPLPLTDDRKIEKEEEAAMRYMSKSGKNWQAHESGIFIHWIEKTDSMLPDKNSKLLLTYTGRFLNGRVFDDAALRGQVLEFVPGTQNQIIKGLEIAVSIMPLGSRAEVIIPFNLAFGKEGSSTGVVGPYKMVIFDLKLKNQQATNI